VVDRYKQTNKFTLFFVFSCLLLSYLFVLTRADAAPPFVSPGVVYTQGDIDTWTIGSPEYTRLASTPAGDVTSGSARFVPVDFGTQINSGGDGSDPNNQLNYGLKNQSGFAKVQAVLYATDGDTDRRDKVVSYLVEYGSVTSFETDPGEQYRLVAGWSCTNLAQAAELINYNDAAFDTFLEDVCYPILDWTANPNWHASFADSRLAIAAYLEDAALWTDAKAYFNQRISQSIYHSTYDMGSVNPLPNSTTPNVVLTEQHWGRT